LYYKTYIIHQMKIRQLTT